MAKHILDSFSKNLFKNTNSASSTSSNNPIQRNSTKTSSNTKLIPNGLQVGYDTTFDNASGEVEEEADSKGVGKSKILEQKQDDENDNENKVCNEDLGDPKSDALISLLRQKYEGKRDGPYQDRRLRHVSTDTDGDSSDASSTSLERMEPPDGGWGWVVVFAAFLINMVSDGVTFSFGIFYVEFYKYFSKDYPSKSTTSWIGSLLASMPLLSGPIASLLTDRFGCRNMTILGSFLACLGFLLASFADNLFVVFLTFGVLTGFGLSLCYVAAVVIVAYYFERKRSLATGLSVCGGGIGTFLFAPFTQYLMDTYKNWWEPTRILSIAFLCLSFCGLLMKDLEWTKRQRNKSLGPSPEIESDEVSGGLKSERMFSSAICIPTFIQEEAKSVNANTQESTSKTSNRMTSKPDNSAQSSNAIGRNTSFTTSNFKRNSLSFSPDTIMRSDHLNLNTEQFNEVKTQSGNDDYSNGQTCSSKANKSDSFRSAKSNTTRPAVNTSNVVDLHRHSLTYRGAVVNLRRYRLRPASSCPDIISVAMDEKTSYEWKAIVANTCKYVKGMYEWKNLKKIRFLLFLFSNFLLYMWYDCPYVYLKDAADHNGYPEFSSSKLISIVGISNMFGNILLGYIGDKKWSDSILVYGICMVVCGATVVSLPLLMTLDYVGIGIGCAVFGLTIAANYSLTSVILVKVVSLDGFSSAYGLLLLVQGVGNLIGPPIAGVIIDLSGAILWAFVVAGSGIFLSSVFILAPKLSICGNENAEVGYQNENGPESEGV